MPTTDGRARERKPPRIEAWWFSVLLPFPLGVTRPAGRYRCTRDHYRAWEQAQAVRQLLPVLDALSRPNSPRTDVRWVARRVGMTSVASARFRADPVALREFLLGHTRMHDGIQEAWWGALRSVLPRDRSWQHLIDASLGAEPPIADSWLFYDHNDVIKWPPAGGGSDAASNRLFGYPAFIDNVVAELMLHYNYACYCQALEHEHHHSGNLLPPTAARAWPSRTGWSVGEHAVGLLLDLLYSDSTAPEAELLQRMTQRRSYDVIDERLNGLRSQVFDRGQVIAPSR